MKKTILFSAVLLMAIWMINQSGNDAGSEDLLMDNVDALASGPNGDGGGDGPTDPWGHLYHIHVILSF